MYKYKPIIRSERELDLCIQEGLKVSACIKYFGYKNTLPDTVEEFLNTDIDYLNKSLFTIKTYFVNTPKQINFSKKGSIFDELIFTMEAILKDLKHSIPTQKKIDNIQKFANIHSEKVKILHTQLITLLMILSNKEDGKECSISEIVLKNLVKPFNLSKLLQDPKITKLLTKEQITAFNTFNGYRNHLLHKESIVFFEYFNSSLIKELSKLFIDINKYVGEIIEKYLTKVLNVLIIASISHTFEIFDIRKLKNNAVYNDIFTFAFDGEIKIDLSAHN